MKKIIILLVSYIFFGTFSVFANSYTLFYGKGCPHCAKVENYLKQKNLTNYINFREVYFNKKNQTLFLKVIQNLGLKTNKVGVPFLYIINNGKTTYKMGDDDVIGYLRNNINSIKSSNTFTGKNILINKEIKNKIFNTINKKNKINISNVGKFLLIMIPAAISDSINPCAFAVMLILLGSILCMYKSRKKVYLSGFLFSFSIFISYFLMGIGLFHAFASFSDTTMLKLIIGILGILVGLANLKDFFWYGKGFVMEVPMSWRPTLKKIIKSITNPLGAFFIGFIVSLFLLPCTSGPYITILGYLASENKTISSLGYFYLFVYNIIFVAPMILITYLVGNGVYTAEHLTKQKDKYIKIIHLIVGLLMLGLGIYVIIDSGILIR